MLITVDATAVRSCHHGVGTYVTNLLQSLVRAEPDTSYHVYMTRTGLANTHIARLAPGRLKASAVTDIRPLRVLWEQLLMASDARRRGADLLWACHNSLPRGRCRCPRVVTVHDLGVFAVPEYYPGSKVAYFRHALARAAAEADLLLAVSDFTAEELGRWLKVSASRVRVVPNGVSGHFRPASSEACRSARIRYSLPDRFILTVGVPEPKKNLTGILAAYRVLERQGRKPPVLVVGGGRSYGWQNRAIYRAIAELGERVLTTDFIDYQDLPAVYSLADCFVFPSFYEGFGLPPLEAMACGTPVIVSNAASMPEVVGDAGLLVNPGDPEDIAAAIGRLLDDPAAGTELRARGLRRAEEWQWPASARRLVDIFREVSSW